MSQENIQLIERAFAALNRHDVEAAEAMADPNCELRTRFTGLSGSVYRGHPGVREWFADVAETWASAKQTPERFIEVDDERTIVVVRFQGLGRGSGVEVDQLIAPIWAVRDQKVVSIETHASVEEALEAVGLTERAMSQENLEIAHRAYAALRRGGIEAFLPFFHPDVRFSSLVLEMEGDFRGHDGMRKWWAGLQEAFPNWDPDVIEMRALGDWVLIHARGQGTGAGGGVHVDDDFWQTVEIRDGLCVRYAAFRTEAEALEAVGLTE